ncbi:putative gustatory receptor 28b [Homalodisca vitripennis]|uniref:putative gustatory receptor 28b n=1 Tax=Homalodisca vitripennis TaxID=197043 RepID=UPI001EEAA38C|nr:putative gustatory receptor 28b [Homalodisca vitripennis]
MQVLSKEVILTSQVFGGFFLTYSSVPNDGQELRFSAGWFTWGLFTTAAQATLPYYWIFHEYSIALSTWASYWTTSTTATVTFLEYTSSSLTSVVVFVSYIRKYRCFVEFHKIMERVEDTWSDLRRQPPESRIDMRILVAFVVAGTIVTIDLAFWGLSTINKLENHIIISISYVSYLTTIFRSTSIFVHFTHVTQYLSKCFKDISIKIEQELARKCFGRQMETQYLPHIAMPQQSSNSPQCEMRTLMHIYCLLFDAVHQANAFYCDQLLAITSYLFFSIVFNLYYVFVTFKSGDHVQFLYAFVWALACVCYTVVIVQSAADVTESADKIVTTICKTIQKDIDPTLRIQLDMFLLQVTNYIPAFSVQHLFKIKNDVLTKMAGAITTYLVILLQFQSQNEEN